MTEAQIPFWAMIITMVGFAVLTAVALWAFDRFRLFAVIFFAIAVTAFPYFSDSSDWLWFDWVKRYFIIFPCLLLALAQWMALKRQMPAWTTWFFAALGFANVFVFVLEDVFLSHWGNVFFGITIMLSFPFRFTYDNKGVVGFTDKFWVIMFCICDAIFIQFCPVIENSYFFVMVILPVEVFMLMFLRDWHKAFAFRLYSLGPFLLIDSFFVEVSNLAYPPAFWPENRIDPAMELISGWIAAILGVYVLYRWQRIRSERTTAEA